MVERLKKEQAPSKERISKKEKAFIRDSILKKYRSVAKTPKGLFCYPVGEKGLIASGYDQEWIKSLPSPVPHFYCGVGNPFSIAAIKKGEAILDIGCGAGVDTLIAGMLTGEEGMADGIDITPFMIERAIGNLELIGLRHVKFQTVHSEQLPFEDQTFHKIISNGVFNLIPDKKAMLDEAYRVLKPFGRLMIADQIMISSHHKPLEERVKNWFQ